MKNQRQLPITVMTITHGLKNIASMVGTCEPRVSVKNGVVSLSGEYVISTDSAVSSAAKASSLVLLFIVLLLTDL